jgi:GH15 family glucan-1,4-alpha-glucosidase
VLDCLIRAAIGASLLMSTPAAASNLVTGNGFGFAVVSPDNATVTRFYARPYRFTQPDIHNSLGEGIETANFIKSLRWDLPLSKHLSTQYVDESQVITARGDSGTALFFMPFGFRHATLVFSWEGPSAEAQKGCFLVEWNRPVSSQRALSMLGTQMQVLKFDGIEESLLLIPLDRERKASPRTREDLGSHLAWALISVETEAERQSLAREFLHWRAGLTPKDLVAREIKEVEHWRVKPTFGFEGEKEKRLWRQSEILLRMAQSRERNRPGRNSHGFIVAALPDGLWVTPWVRDMAYATVALARMGHRDEARAALLAYFNAQPTGKMRNETGGADYQISVVRYFGDGSEEPFFTMEGSTNIEFDNWGLVLWALGEYLQHYDDRDLLHTPTYRGRLYESARDYIAKPLLTNLEVYGPGLIVASDTSIWEERQKDKKHFAFSTAAAIVGLQNFAETAGLVGDESTRSEVLKQVALLEKGFSAAFVRGGHLRGTLEEGMKNDIDGALLAVINLGIVTNPAILEDTIERMELLKVRSGGYRRVRSILTDPSIFEYWYERQEFLFVDLSLAEVYGRMGKEAEAVNILKRIVAKSSADYNFVPEMYVAESCSLFPGEVGDPTGAIPMVGYGAGEYIIQQLLRADRSYGQGSKAGH